MAEGKGLKPHAIMFPVPYQGHITPLTNLAIKLATNGFTVTFVHTDFIHHLITKSHEGENCSNTEQVDIFADARKNGLDIRYTTIPDGFPMEFDRHANFDEFWDSLLADFPARVDECIGKIIDESPPSLVPFLIVDSFYSWPPQIANKYNMVFVSFMTEPALVFSINYHFDLLRENDHFPPKNEEEITYIPGVDSISTKDLMVYCVAPDARTRIEYRVVFGAFDKLKKADFILHNTVYELESNVLLALNKRQPTYAIGPTNFYPECTKSMTVATSVFQKKSVCIEWLNSKPRNSVLYVSFGSLAQADKKVTEEVAYALLQSGVNFIWILRENYILFNDLEALPAEFKTLIGDKGLIIPWCDQKEVLSNPAVGGFVTHCGWNSVLESMWFGVPMICYPVMYDQPTNRKLVVDDWKIGVNLCDGISVSRDEVASKIKSLMTGENSHRQEIKKISKILHDAVEKDGSSDRYLDQFIKDLKAKILC